ncbi:hypothetical protein [Oryzihumus sp.]
MSSSTSESQKLPSTFEVCSEPNRRATATGSASTSRAADASWPRRRRSTEEAHATTSAPRWTAPVSTRPKSATEMAPAV